MLQKKIAGKVPKQRPGKRNVRNGGGHKKMRRAINEGDREVRDMGRRAYNHSQARPKKRGETWAADGGERKEWWGLSQRAKKKLHGFEKGQREPANDKEKI